MERPDHLIAAIADEDRRLRELLAACPPERRERSGPGGLMSPKEVLGHLAFWDTFAVRFFEQKLARGKPADTSVDFDRLNRQEMRQLRHRPWEETLERYHAATAELVRFLQTRWRALSDDERASFLTPLRHRRHHRLLLARALREEGIAGLRKHEERA